MATILRCGPVADAAREEAIEVARPLMEGGEPPSLCLIRANDDDAAVSYERSLVRAASDLGFETTLVTMSSAATEVDLIQAVEDADMDPGIDGVMVLTPLPEHVDASAVMNAIYPSKDIDGATDLSMSGVFTGRKIGVAPATPEAVIRILDHYHIAIEGKSVTVVGRSLVVGKPVSMMLLDRDATVTLCHSRTPDLGKALADADIVVSAIGKPRFLTRQLLAGNPDKVVIDVGVNVDDDGKLCGDVDMASIDRFVGAVTPVPGGVGAVVTSILLLHCAMAARSRRG